MKVAMAVKKNQTIGGNLNIVNAAQVAVVKDDGKPRRGRDQGELNLIAGGAVVIRDGKIVDVGPTEKMSAWLDNITPVIDASGKTVMPGLIETHSHPLFACDRHDEYAQRLAGVACKHEGHGPNTGGGQVNTEAMKSGFWSNVIATRASSVDDLLRHLEEVYQWIIQGGVTTLEVKSGYGLSVEEELRELSILHESRRLTPIDLVLTFLGAHVAPPDMDPEDYVDLIIGKMLPAVIEQGLAEFHDVTCEANYFTQEQARRLLVASSRVGMPTRVHADGWKPSGGWPVAVTGGATAADHLTFTTDDEIRRVGPTETIAVLLPAAELTYMTPVRANARLFIETGVPVAIATDYCSAIRATSLINSVAMACPWFGITPAESIVGATLNAAYVLRRNDDRGSLDVGKRGDVLILDVPHPNAACHAIGAPIVDTVIVKGEPVFSNQHQRNYQ